MKNAPAKTVYSRLHALSRAREENFQLTLNAYARERLLYRLGRSPYRRQFILKGATLFTVWAGTPYRSTMDVDFLGHGTPDPEHLATVFQALCKAKVRRDGVEFLPGSVRTGLIREDQKYGGYWVRLEVRIGKARIPVKIEVGFGDIVVPKARETVFPTLLKMPKPRLRTYRRETMIAEKFQAMVRFELDNTRMKDYYDLWMLSREFAFDGKPLSGAIRATFDRRKTPSVRANTPENARLTFDHVVTDRLQDMVDTNFEFYKRVTDDREFAKFFLDWLFGRVKATLGTVSSKPETSAPSGAA